MAHWKVVSRVIWGTIIGSSGSSVRNSVREVRTCVGSYVRERAVIWFLRDKISYWSLMISGSFGGHVYI